MNTRQIAVVLRNDPKTQTVFQGVFASDRLPSYIDHYPAAFVANVDPHTQPGSHWCAFYFTKDQQGEFFDSYGRKPQDYSDHFKQFLENNSKQWTYNHKELQCLTSNVCGHYCLYFLLNRCRNLCLKTIVNRFTKKCTKNDRIVYHFITRHFGHLIRSVRGKSVIHQVSKHNKQRM